MSVSVSWEVPVNVSLSFGYDEVNKLRCSAVLIWLK